MFWLIIFLLFTLFPFTGFITLWATELGRYDYGGYSIIGLLVLVWYILLIIDSILTKRIVNIIDFRQEVKYECITSNSTYNKFVEKKLLEINLAKIFSYIMRWWILPFLIIALILGLIYFLMDI